MSRMPWEGPAARRAAPGPAGAGAIGTTRLMSAVCILALALWCAYIIQHAPQGEPMPGAPASFMEVTK